MPNDVEIGSLTLQISANAQSAATQIDALSKSLGGLNTAVGKMQGLSQLSAQLAKFSQDMNQLTYAVGTFKEFKTAANAIKNTVKALKELETLDMGNAEFNLRELTSTFAILQDVDKASGFTSVVNNLKKLPSVAKQLGEMDVYAFAADIMNVSGALEPLAKQMDRVSAGFAAFPQKLNAVHSASVRTAGGFSTLENRLNRLFSFAIARRIGRIFGDLITKSTQYVEDLNLFTVAMGNYADKAKEYAETVSETMGIDPAQWLRHQGVFQTLATGFGVTSDRAAIMSKNLTQLAYDLSSFYNLPIDKAMQKLESGFAGEIEPVRRLGYDLSKTALQATAASLGITKLFADMTQAEKSQLRYYALMTQVTQVQGDMARTLEAPANQLRILKAQLEVAARAIGNIFIPLLNAVLPYLIAFAKFVRLVADAIANFFGYKLPEIDYSGVSAGIGDVDDAMEDLDDSTGRTYNRAKKLKNLLASFDELNIIQSESGGGSGNGSGGIGDLGSSGWKDFELPEYDFLGNLLGSRADAILEKFKRKFGGLLRWVKNHLSEIWDVVKAIGIGLLGWKVGSSLAKLFGAANPGKIGLGIGLSIAGFSLEFSGARNIGAGKAQLWDYIKLGLGSALGIAGLTLIGGTAGLIAGIPLALTVAMVGIYVGFREEVEENLAEQFADIFSGALEPERYLAIVQRRFDEISRGMSEGIELNATVNADIGAIEDIILKLDNYRLKIEGVGTLTQDEVDEMNAAFANLKLQSGQYIEDTYDLLEHGLLTALRVLPDETKTAVQGYLSELGVLEGEAKTTLDKYNDLYQEAMNNANAALPGSEEREKWLDAAAEYQIAIGILTGAYVDGADQMRNAMFAADANIDNVNFSNIDSIRQYLDRVGSAFEETKGTILEYWGGMIETAQREMNAALFVGDQDRANELAGIIESYKAASAISIQELEGVYTEETMGLVRRLLENAPGLVEQAVNNHDNGFINTLIAGLFGEDTNQAFLANQYGSDFVTDVILPALNVIMQEGSTEAAQVASSMLGAMTTWNAVDGQYMYRSSWLDMVNAGLDAVDSLTGEAEIAGESLGTSVTDGFRAGAASQMTMLNDIGTEMGDAFGGNLLRAVQARVDAVGARLSNWWTHIRPRGGDPSDPYNWGNIEITPFATGGIPKAGSLFLAGEGGGAELVGSMGNQTAVANGDQIVSGIAYGVQMANASEERVLREILNTLRQIAKTGGNVVFSPSPEAGRAIQYALNMYQTQRGY